MNYIYLASPYTHQYKCVEVERFNLVCECAAFLMKKGYHIFSPIAHTHPIAMVGDLPTHFEYWQDYDKAMLRNAGGLWVLCLSGWELSTGIKGEIELAKEYGVPIHYLQPNRPYSVFDPRRTGDANNNKSS